MSPHFRVRRFGATSLIMILILAVSYSSSADEGCFTERGRIQTVNIIEVAVSGHLVTSLQRGSWDTRPTVRVAEVRPHGTNEVGTWKPVWYVADIAINASTAFVAADGGLFALDLSDPSNPVELSFVDLIDSQHLALDGDHAYVVTTGVSGNGWFDVVEISDPSATQRIGGIFWPRPDPPKYAIDADGNTVVIADQDGLLVLDVSNPLDPVEVGRWNHPEARDVTLVGDYAVMTFAAWANPGELGVTVVDLSEPTSPTPVGRWEAPSEVLSVAEYGGAVAVGTESDGVFLIDIGDPANPRQIDHRGDLGMGVQALATAWPTIATSNVVFGLAVLGLHRSCIPPRRPTSRLTP
jgi:hypothetical protein